MEKKGGTKLFIWILLGAVFLILSISLISSILNKNIGLSPQNSCVYGDISPCGGNGVVDLDDILSVLSAFSGTYNCPGDSMCEEPFCTESDKGYNLLEKGTITNRTGVFEERCLSSDIILEYHCNPEDISVGSSTSCSGELGPNYECQNGACVFIEPFDLGITDIKAVVTDLTEFNITSGKTLVKVNLSANITNLEGGSAGTSGTGFLIFKDGGLISLKTYFTPSMGPGQSYEIKDVFWANEESGQYVFNATADYYNQFDETNENNNKRSVSFEV